MILFWALLIWGAYVLISNANRKSQGKEQEDDPRRILDQRLARGEIDAEEYWRLNDLLTSGTHHAPAGGSRT